MQRHVVHVCGQEIDQPGHICAFFSSREEEYATLLPFFRDGIDQGEHVLNVVDDEDVAARRAALERDGVPVGDDGATVIGSTSTYLIDGRFDMDRMAGFVEQALAAARADGKRVRTCGSMSWLQRNAPGSERAIEYEARMNLLVPKFDCTFMCAYRLDELSGETVVDIMSTHPFVILNGEIRENSFYIPPERYLSELLNARPKKAS